MKHILPAPPNTTVPGGSATTTTTAPPATGKVVLYTVLFDVANIDAALMPQMTAQMFFVTARVVDVITAPLPAIQAVADKPGVYTARVLNADGRITTREVYTGICNRLTTEVLSGLDVGDKLVTSVRHGKTWAGRFRL